VLGAGPQDYWRLGDGAGTVTAANEVSAGTATYANATLGAAGPFADRTAASFNGSSSYLGLPSTDRSGTGQAAIAVWFKTTGSSEVLYSTQNTAVTAGATAPGYTPTLYVGADGHLEASFWVNDTTKTMSSKSVVNDGKWHFTVLSTNGSAQGFYVDGRVDASVSGALVATGQGYVAVGAGYLGGGWPDIASTTTAVRWFNGSISDMTWYDHQLSTGQVTAQWEASRSSGGLAPVTTVKVTDPGGKTLSYEYDPLNGNRQIASTDGRGDKTTYGYDTGGFLYTVTDPDGNVTTTGHDPRGNVVSTTTCQDQTARACSTVYKTYYPDDSSAQLTTADPRNDQVLTIRDGRSASATDGTYETSYTYDTAGDVTAVTTPPVPGFTAGRKTAVTYSDGSSTYPASDSGNVPKGLPVKIVSPGGATQVIAYDHLGDITSTKNADGLLTSYAYDQLGRVLTKTQVSDTYPNGLVTSYVYDWENRAVTETDARVTDQVTGAVHTAQTTTAYDPDGNVSSQTVADTTGGDASRTVSYVYTSNGQVKSETDAAGALTSYTYDAYGNKATETDPDGNVASYAYDPNGNLTSTTLLNYTGDPAHPSTPANLIEESRAYDPAGRLQSVTDAMGNSTSYTYTDNGLLATATRTGQGGTGTYVEESDSYDAAGNLIKKVTSNGATTANYTVDAADRVAAATEDPAGADRITQTSYTPDDKPATVTQTTSGGATQVTSYAYDPMGNPTSRSVTGSSTTATTTWKLDQRGLPTSMTDPDGNVTTYLYDEAGHQAEVSAPAVTTQVYGLAPLTANPVTYYGYDTFGDQAEVKDPDSNVTSYGYDGDGHVTSQTLPPYTPPGGSSSITAPSTYHYDGNGNLTSQQDPLGNVTTSQYDQLGDLANVTTAGADGGTTYYTYDTDGRRLSTTGPTGAQATATYDFLGRDATSTVVDRYPSAQALTTRYSYAQSAADPGGAWLSGVTTPDGATTSYGYDNLGERATVTDGAADTTSYGYDFLGRQASVTAPNGTRQVTSYDALGDPVQVQESGTTGPTLTRSATYDSNGNMLSATDANQRTKTFTYGATGLLASEVQPVAATSSIATSFGYDAAGNQTVYTDGNGSNWYTTYNSWSLPESKVEPATSAYTTAADSTLTMAYDADGRPAAYTEPGGVTLAYGYDALGNLTSEAGSGADAPTANRTFGYDQAGNVLTAATSAASAAAPATSEAFTYNDRGQVLTASGTAGSTTLGYNGDGLLSSRADAAGTTSYSYDGADRLSGLTDPATGASLTYGYTSNQLTSVSYGTGGATRGYGYDGLGRLTSDTLTSASGTQVASIGYTYDSNGNLTQKATTGLAGATANVYTYDWANRLASWNNGTTTTNYGYDANGNRTSVGSATYSYDARDELTSDGTSTYAYTARGTLASTTGSAGTGAATADAYGQQLTDGGQSYAYDALGRMTAVTPSSGPATTLSYSGGTSQLASDGTSTYSRTPDGSLVGIGTAGGASGSGVLAMTDQHTDVVADFAPAGTALSGSTAYDPLGNVITTTGALAGNLGYQSAFTDPVSKKALMGARWYNPAAGQFTSRDTASNSPVPNSADANPFAYAGDNPLTGIDPSGHSWWSTATSWASDAWNTATSWASDAWNTATSWASDAWDAVSSAATSAWDATISALDEEIRQLNAEIAALDQEIKDLAHEVTATVSRVYHRVTHVARKVYHKAVSLVRTGYHEVRRVARAGASWVAHHRAAIASFAAGAAVFAGCEALTAGVGSVGCAAAAGAIGNLVSYGMSCGSAGGCTVAGALVSAGVGAVAGAAAGAIAGPLGGKLASSALGDVLPSFAIEGLAGSAAGAASEAAAGAAGYGAQCAEGRSCSWGGLAGAAASGAAAGAAAGAAFGSAGGAARDVLGGSSSAPEGEAPAEEGNAGSCARSGGQSFTAGTLVLLATGATEAISHLHTGQKVLATDTRTGKTRPEAVTAVLIHHDTDLYDLKITDGGKTAVIHTTSSHLFWDPYPHYDWIPAKHLKPGMHLKTPDGQTAVVVGGSVPAAHDGWMWDLTVPGNNDHDFYVIAGYTPVLVHNSSCPTGFDYEGASQSGMRADKGGFTRAGREYAKHMGGSQLPTVTGNPAAISSAGQDMLNSILTDPGADYQPVPTGNFAGGYRIIGNTVVSGRFVGATFDANGLFQYFGMYG
jgi:large repetitive protein